MRYFFISDIHGEYDKMIDSLRASGFDRERDTLVNLGDSFDRGPKSLEVLDFLMNLPNKILIMGNHDLRLEQMVTGESYPDYYDVSNGVKDTFLSFSHGNLKYGLALDIEIFTTDNDYLAVKHKLLEYFCSCANAAVWDDLVAVHSWYPSITNPECTNWEDAIWANTKNQIMYCEKFHRTRPVEQPMIMGHYFAYLVRQLFDNVNNDFSTYVTPDGMYTLIDGASNYKLGKINVVVKNEDKPPKLIK
jgi:hypothetical protein